MLFHKTGTLLSELGVRRANIVMRSRNGGLDDMLVTVNQR